MGGCEEDSATTSGSSGSTPGRERRTLQNCECPSGRLTETETLRRDIGQLPEATFLQRSLQIKDSQQPDVLKSGVLRAFLHLFELKQTVPIGSCGGVRPVGKLLFYLIFRNAYGGLSNRIGARNYDSQENYTEKYAWPNGTRLAIKYCISSSGCISQENKVVHVVGMAYAINYIPEYRHIIQAHIDYKIDCAYRF